MSEPTRQTIPCRRARSSPCVLVLLAAATCLSPSIAAQEAPDATRIEILDGSTAEYRVREQLARLDFPNDAIGTTSLTGSLTIGADGSVGGGPLTVDLRELESDSGRRDAFIRENTLETDRFPVAEFVPTGQRGLPIPLPLSGEVTFGLVGDMTIHGVTRELTWDVRASFEPGAVSGDATTRFPFDTFDLAIPKVFGLLSVDDDIRLVLTFRARVVDPT